MKLNLRFTNTLCTPAEAMSLRMQQMKGQGRINSFYRIRSARRAFMEYAGEEFQFHDVTATWLRRCEEHWRRRGLNPTSINIYMKVLKAEFNLKFREGKIKAKDMPFGKGKYEIPAPVSRAKALTPEQIASIVAFKGDATLEYYRDLWLFSYLCNGINFRDMLFLQYKNIIDDEIVFVRAKTIHSSHRNSVIHAPLLPLMKDIIKRIGNEKINADTYIFKCAAGDETAEEIALKVRTVISMCNRKMKKIAYMLGIPSFTTYSARHSYATILNKKGVGLSYISESLGHSSLEMTRNYLAGSTSEERIRMSKFLLE